MSVKTQLKIGVILVVGFLLLSWYEGWNPQKIINTTPDYRSAGNQKRLNNAKDEPHTAAIELVYDPKVPHPDDEPVFDITWIKNGESHHDVAAKQGLWFVTFSVRPGDVILASFRQKNARYQHPWEATIWHVSATGGIGDHCTRGGFGQSCTLRYVVR